MRKYYEKISENQIVNLIKSNDKIETKLELILNKNVQMDKMKLGQNFVYDYLRLKYNHIKQCIIEDCSGKKREGDISDR